MVIRTTSSSDLWVNILDIVRQFFFKRQKNEMKSHTNHPVTAHWLRFRLYHLHVCHMEVLSYPAQRLATSVSAIREAPGVSPGTRGLQSSSMFHTRAQGPGLSL